MRETDMNNPNVNYAICDLCHKKLHPLDAHVGKLNNKLIAAHIDCFNVESIKNEFKNIGYVFLKETKKYIEFRTSEYGVRERLKINKYDYEITKDCTTSQGNRGHRNITYNELILINRIIDILRN